MLTILYHEHKVRLDLSTRNCADMSHPVTDRVEVTLRKWNGQGVCDVVCETQVMIDGQITVDSRTCLNGFARTDAELQRYAIARFDELLAAHPAPGWSD